LCGALCAGAQAQQCAGLEFDAGRIRQPPPNARVAAGFMTIFNTSDQPATITAVHADGFAAAEIHETRYLDGRARMSRLETLYIPAVESLVLESGGPHLMLFGPSAPLLTDQTVALSFRCADDSIRIIDLPVLRDAD
jgi:copper(I)-binding protein